MSVDLAPYQLPFELVVFLHGLDARMDLDVDNMAPYLTVTTPGRALPPPPYPQRVYAGYGTFGDELVVDLQALHGRAYEQVEPYYYGLPAREWFERLDSVLLTWVAHPEAFPEFDAFCLDTCKTLGVATSGRKSVQGRSRRVHTALWALSEPRLFEVAHAYLQTKYEHAWTSGR